MLALPRAAICALRLLSSLPPACPCPDPSHRRDSCESCHVHKHDPLPEARVKPGLLQEALRDRSPLCYLSARVVYARWLSNPQVLVLAFHRE